MKTLIIDNFTGRLTLKPEGDINSGLSYVQNVSGQNPFVKPGNLTWNNAPIQIDSGGSVINDLVMCGKERVESGILYVYAVGHTGRVYKIQVNRTSPANPDYDNPVLLATIASGTPTFTRGGFIDFFGSTERIYIGHDKGVTRLDFDGTNETALGGTWTQNVPRPLKQFLGNLYAGNGSNIAEIIAAGTQSTPTKLSPGFPTNSQVRDLDVTPDGNYIEMVVSELALNDITSTAQQTTSIASVGSYVFQWNGTDTGYTAFRSYPSFSLTANIMFQNYKYLFGSDQFGTAMYNENTKLISWTESPSIMPNAVSANGNLVNFLVPVYYNNVLEADFVCWGSFDFEVGNPIGYWNQFFLNATAPETDIILTPFQMSVSGPGLGSSSNGYTNNIFGTSKIYFSTLETSSGTTAYRFYKWSPLTSLQISSLSPIVNAVYQTQTQIFSKKVEIKEVRIYSEPWVANNSFSLDLIGSAGTAISGGSKTFTAQNSDPSAPMYVGTDYAWWNPSMAPTYSIGLFITNLGSTNFTINKIEIDYKDGGK